MPGYGQFGGHVALAEALAKGIRFGRRKLEGRRGSGTKSRRSRRIPGKGIKNPAICVRELLPTIHRPKCFLFSSRDFRRYIHRKILARGGFPFGPSTNRRLLRSAFFLMPPSHAPPHQRPPYYLLLWLDSSQKNPQVHPSD